MRARPLVAVATGVLVLLTACGGDDEGSGPTTTTTTEAASASSTTTTEGATTETTEPLTDDRTTTSAPVDAGAPYEPAVCDQLVAAIEAITLPSDGGDDAEAQLDASLAAIEAAAVAAPGYPADELGYLADRIETARDEVVADGFAGWLRVIAGSRADGEAESIEAHLEGLRAYVLPRC